MRQVMAIKLQRHAAEKSEDRHPFLRAKQLSASARMEARQIASLNQKTRSRIDADRPFIGAQFLSVVAI